LASPPPEGSVTPTPRLALAVAALFGALGGWVIFVSAGALDLVPPSIPWTAPAGLILIMALVGVLAYTTHQRIQVRRERVEAQRAVGFLVLGKASALAGALVAGGYLTYALLFVGRLAVAGPRDRVIKSAIACVAGVGLCVAGLLLERACRVPDDHGDDEDEEEAESQSGT
jgi:uncharacterized membrane protein YjfL (UPF0719 family)